MKPRWPVHPLFFAVYPALQLFVCNVAGLKISDPLWALAGSIALALLATGLCRLALGDLRKAAILATAFVWLFFSYEGFQEGLRALRIGRFHPDRPWVIAALWLIGLGCAFYGLRRTRRDLAISTRLLNATSGFLLLTCVPVLIFRLAGAAGFSAGHSVIGRAAGPSEVRAGASPGHAQGRREDAPDIYFILLDQYPRSDVLRLGFGYDNSWFLSDLRRMGFYVAEHSASNYPRTAMTIASMLNLDYLGNLLGKVKENNPDLGLPAKCISHNFLFRFMKEHGYRTVYLPPELGAGDAQDADVRLESHAAVPEFVSAILDMTPVEPIMQFCAPAYSPAELHRRHVRFTLESLRKLPRMGWSPFFVYAHILCPHPPIVFGPNGEKVSYNLDEQRHKIWAMSPEARHFYTDQLAWISKEAEKIVAEILAQSKRPPVIVLCSDHGSDFEVDWLSAEKSNLQERMANLETFYFPGGGAKFLYPSITNVNIFRILLNCYFGEHYELLPDKSYFSTNNMAYRFIQVPMDVPYAPFSRGME